MTIKIKTPLFENVANLLRRRILIKDFQQGEHLNEVTISRELNISRGPVRDAIKLLEKEGMVETLQNGRTVAVGFTRQSFEDWTRARIAFECFAIEEISSKQEKMDDQYTMLNELVRFMNRLKDEQSDLKSFIDLDLQFHHHLVSMSGNRTLIIAWESIYSTLKTIIELSADNYGSIKQTEVHIGIANKLIQHEYQEAALLLSNHIIEGEKNLLSVLKL